MIRVDLAGQRFGKLIAVRFVGRGPSNKTMWECGCDCGLTTIATQGNLRSGNSKSCGCEKHRTTHGHTRKSRHTREYRSWAHAIARCHGPKPDKCYAPRGIIVCQKWRHSFEAFLADMGMRPPGTSLDRFPDNDGNYEPENCRWATPKQQGRNTRSNVLTESSVREIRGRVELGESQRSMMKRFGVSSATVSNVVNDKTWSGVR